MLTERRDQAAGTEALSDADLIGRSLAHPACFAVIFDRHADEILRYADARPWLYGIAVRQIGRHRRAGARQLRLLRSMPAEPPGEALDGRAAERVTAEQLRLRLAAVLAGLSGDDRELLLLIAWAGLSYAESAQAMGLTVSAVKSRLNRIRTRTRQALGGANPMGPDPVDTDEETSDG